MCSLFLNIFLCQGFCKVYGNLATQVAVNLPCVILAQGFFLDKVNAFSDDVCKNGWQRKYDIF